MMAAGRGRTSHHDDSVFGEADPPTFGILRLRYAARVPDTARTMRSTVVARPIPTGRVL